VSKNLKKINIIKDLSVKTGYSSNYSKKVINELIDAILQNIKNGHLNLKNIGSFKIISKKERIGRNPKTKKEYIISKRKSVSFKASKSLLSELNKFYE
tara:strand:+ start:344 stop:637 length:294 start_codon:yes stop_codon:yes gene_type:complete